MVLVVLPGCGTILTTVVPRSSVNGENDLTIPWVYSGTFFDYHCFWHPLMKGTDNVELFCLIDIPLSVVADTIILPVTIPLQVSNKKADESYQQSTMQGTGGDDISATGQEGIAGTRVPQESGSDQKAHPAADYISGDSNLVGIHEARTYCPNADRGNADAQMYIGDMHYLGAYKLKRDPVRAWVWYSLAAQKGDALATEQLSKVTAELTPEQLEEAKRQLEAWQPGQCIKGLVPDQKTQ
jgi:uncharacterized protein YceK